MQENILKMLLKENHKVSNSLKIDSTARFYIEVNEQDELIDLYKFINKNEIKYLVLGEGTNLVPPDFFDGIVIKPNFNEVLHDSNNKIINVGASVNWHKLVNICIEKNIYGFENLSLIPGTVGAAPIQNIGAYGQEVSNLIDKINCFDIEKGEFKTLNNSSCKFKYRNSIFKNNSLLIISVDFKTDCKKEFNIEYNSIINHMDKIGFKKTNLSLETLSNLICDIRNKTLPDPNIIPNAGSFFKNAEVKISEIDDSEFSLDELIIWDIGNNKVKVGSARLIELVKDRSVVITIDDAYSSVYEYAWPIFKKYNFPDQFITYSNNEYLMFSYQLYKNNEGKMIYTSKAKYKDIQTSSGRISSIELMYQIQTYDLYIFFQN